MSLSGRQKIHDEHYQTQEGKHTSRSPVQSFGRCLIGKPGGQPCPYKREKDTEQQGRNIRNPSDGKVGNRAGKCREGHDKDAGSYCRFQFIAQNTGEDKKHHHSAAGSDKAADKSDQGSAEK